MELQFHSVRVWDWGAPLGISHTSKRTSGGQSAAVASDSGAGEAIGRFPVSAGGRRAGMEAQALAVPRHEVTWEFDSEWIRAGASSPSSVRRGSRTDMQTFGPTSRA